MPKQLGRVFLLKIGDGGDPGTFTAFAGMTQKSLSINNERIDATTPDKDNPENAMWRETLDGVKSVDCSGDFTLVGGVSEARVVTIAMSQKATEDFEVVVPGIGTFKGTFSVDLEFGEDGKVTGSISLQSTGPVTFTPAA